jgi:hypothetical protein
MTRRDGLREKEMLEIDLGFLTLDFRRLLGN